MRAAHHPGPGGLAIKDLWKAYDTNVVLKGVDVSFEFGRVHALLGANGAGKSTLLGCISGAVHPDRAEIVIGDDQYSGFTPRRAFDAGIAIIYQHFQLIGPLTVAENIFLGRELRRPGGSIDRQRQEQDAAKVLADLGTAIDPAARVESLSVGAQQVVEIARAVRLQPRVLILDEPTAALGNHEVAGLLALVRRLASRGIAVVYVTHLLGEVLEVADDVTVLRDGNVLWTRQRLDVVLPDLVEAISPDASGAHARRAADVSKRAPIVALEGVTSTRTGPIDLQIRPGEIVGLFGLLGSGRTDLLEGLAGVRATHGGSVKIGETRSNPAASPRQAQGQGILLVPSNRKEQSLFGTMSALENMLMPHLGAVGRGRGVRLRSRRQESRIFVQMAEAVGLVPANPSIAADGFSGGNAQKIAVARWMCGTNAARLLLMDEPTQGVDVGARRDLYDLITQWCEDARAAVLFATSDPEEVLALADRVVILAEGRVVHAGPADLSEQELIALAQPRAGEEGIAS